MGLLAQKDLEILLVFVDIVKIIKSLGVEFLVAEKSHLKSPYWGIFADFGQTGPFRAIKF